MLPRTVILIALVTVLGACVAPQVPDSERFARYPQRYRQFDLDLAWDYRTADAATIIEGVVKNVRYARMDGLEIWVALPGGAGKAGERSVAFVIPPMLTLDQSETFSLKLPREVRPGEKLEFTYTYRAFEGGDKTGLSWLQSFTTEVPAK